MLKYRNIEVQGMDPLNEQHIEILMAFTGWSQSKANEFAGNMGNGTGTSILQLQDENASKFIDECRKVGMVAKVIEQSENETANDSVYCYKCGTKLDADATFCSGCGTKVIKKSALPEPISDEKNETIEAGSMQASTDNAKTQHVSVEKNALDIGEIETLLRENKSKGLSGKKITRDSECIVIEGTVSKCRLFIKQGKINVSSVSLARKWITVAVACILGMILSFILNSGTMGMGVGDDSYVFLFISGLVMTVFMVAIYPPMVRKEKEKMMAYIQKTLPHFPIQYVLDESSHEARKNASDEVKKHNDLLNEGVMPETFGQNPFSTL